MATKDQLLEEAVILEQEGWLLGRLSREMDSRRMRAFNKRYEEWQARVKEARSRGEDMWPEPPDNS
jgi:hypothetical protein